MATREGRWIGSWLARVRAGACNSILSGVYTAPVAPGSRKASHVAAGATENSDRVPRLSSRAGVDTGRERRASVEILADSSRGSVPLVIYW